MEKNKTKKGKILNPRFFFFPFLAFLLGVVTARRLYLGDTEMIIVLVVLLFALFALMFLSKKIFLFSFLICLFFVGSGFYFLGEKSFDVKQYNGEVTVVGRVTDDIVSYDYSARVLLDDVKINGENGEKINLYISNCTQPIEPGSMLTFSTTLTPSETFINENFNSSDYRSGARYNGQVKYSDLNIYDGHIKFDEQIRLSVKKVLQERLSERNAGITYALLFGDKNDLDQDVQSAYKNTGIIHILTVSGLHIGFLVTLFYGVLKKCRVNKYACTGLTVLFILFYSYLCGFTPSVMRAGIMAIIYMCAKTFGKKYDSLNSLGLAGFVICLLMPLAPYDLGFLMSFFCVFAILTLSPVFLNFFKKFLPEKIAELIALSFSAQIGIAQFIAKMGGKFHILSFLLNLIIVPLFSIIYPYIFIINMLSTFLPFLGVLLLPVNYAFDFINLVVNLFNASHLTIPLPSNYFVVSVIFFIAIFGASRYLMIDSLKKFALFTLTSFLAVMALGLYHLPTKFYPNISRISSDYFYSQSLKNSNREITVDTDKNICYNINYSPGFLGHSTDRRLTDKEISQDVPVSVKNSECLITTLQDGGMIFANDFKGDEGYIYIVNDYFEGTGFCYDFAHENKMEAKNLRRVI